MHNNVQRRRNLRAFAAVAAIAAAVLVAYSNSFRGVFIEDSKWCVRDNPHIRRLWPLSEAISLPMWNSGETMDGRPVLSLSFAVNQRLLGPDAWSYRVVNVAIHIAAALLLFGIVRRTVQKVSGSSGESGGAGVFRFSGCEHPTSNIQHSTSMSRIPSSLGRWMLDVRCWMFGHDSEARSPVPVDRKWLALIVALLWAVHPLQTQSVTYIVQRSESLAGLFYLLTLYCAIRGMAGSRAWFAGSAAACLLGVGTKEVVATAPLMVLLYDYFFVAGSFRSALSRRRGLYAGLCATWLLMIATILLTSKTKLADWHSTPPLLYALTQAGVVLHYLKLAVWPYPLVMDYTWPLVTGAAEIMLPSGIILLLLAGTVWGLYRKHWCGFLGAWFFLILAPTSSFLPLAPNDYAAEHRMYLPLAAVVAAVVCGGQWAVTRSRRIKRVRQLDEARGSALPRWAPAMLGVFVAVALVCVTRDRNRDYHDEFTFWMRNLERRPRSISALQFVSDALCERGDYEAAVAYCRRALALAPDSYSVHCDLASALIHFGKLDEAVTHLERALDLNPAYHVAHEYMGRALNRQARPRAAIEHFRRTLELNPRCHSAHCDWGNALTQLGRTEESTTHYRAALALNPGSYSAHCDWGNALVDLGRINEAIDHYRRAIRINPGYFRAHSDWAHALMKSGDFDGAAAHFREAVAINPRYAAGHYMLANAIVHQGKPQEAVQHYRKALKIDPQYQAAHNNLGSVLDHLGRTEEAVACCKRAAEIDPNDYSAHYNWANALRKSGNHEGAAQCYRRALALKADYAPAHNNLGSLLVDAGMFEEGIEHLKEAARLSPGARIYYNMGVLCDRRGRTDEASEHWRKALALAESSGDAPTVTRVSALIARGTTYPAPVGRASSPSAGETGQED